tara:strand:- start:7015 stop:9852 length:2838 start_codon:yes stop_codon:yes gene_type:complete
MFILVAPLPLDGLVDEENLGGCEVILQLSGGDVWGQTEWEALEQYGYIPLRLLTPTELVAWKNDGAQHPDAYESGIPNALWKSIPDEGQTVRVVFEPGLPDSILDQLHQKMQLLLGKDLSSIEKGHLASTDIVWDSSFQMEWFENFPGILWLEPELMTVGRNLESATLLSGIDSGTYPSAWTFGLNGSGVVIGVADTGIDSDHSCFRNVSDSSIGPDHRKLLYVNTTIDDWDNSGHADYRHGTHAAGILGCHPYTTATEENIPSAVMALGYDTKLVVQDIVSEEGWSPPDVDLLLAESAMYGGYLHSNSWGDDTTDYTLRSADFDAFTREFPWTLPLIAPGNDGGFVLEPANARNVVAIGASTKDSVPERWMSSVHGPTDAETRGIFALAPGVSIVSARSDGSPDTYNAGQYTSSGTSMSTPMAATYSSIIQQMVQEGWLTGHNETLEVYDLQSGVPWFESNIPQRSILLGEGFVPSAPLMKSLLSLSSTPLDDEYRNGGEGGSDAPNNYDGWGVLNLSELIDFEDLETVSTDVGRPVSNIWIHDSYRLVNELPSDLIAEREGDAQPIEYLMENTWDGEGAVGPFLSTGDVFQQRFILQDNESLDVRLSFQAKPEPHLVDDVQLMVRLPDGRFAVGEHYRQDGRSMLYYDFADHLDTTVFPSTNETTVGVRLDANTLEDIDYVDVLVVGRYITPGNQPGTLGIDGDRVGFGLAIRGVELDPLNHSDGDGDSIPYEQDLCPFTNAFGWDMNDDGCIDDTDIDGVEDDVDACPMTPEQVPVDEAGCAEQNEAPRIFLDESLLLSHDNETITILFSVLDEDSVEVTVSLERAGSPVSSVDVCLEIITNDSWRSCSVNASQDFFPLNAVGNWTAYIVAEDLNTSSWTMPAMTSYRSGTFTVHPIEPVSETYSSSNSWFTTAILTSLISAIILAFVIQLWFNQKSKEENL